MSDRDQQDELPCEGCPDPGMPCLGCPAVDQRDEQPSCVACGRGQAGDGHTCQRDDQVAKQAAAFNVPVEAMKAFDQQDEQATRHVHEPAGPGEYCIGCFDQGAVWAEHEERARVRQIIATYQDKPCPAQGHDERWCARCSTVEDVLDDLLAALNEGTDDVE